MTLRNYTRCMTLLPFVTFWRPFCIHDWIKGANCTWFEDVKRSTMKNGQSVEITGEVSAFSHHRFVLVNFGWFCALFGFFVQKIISYKPDGSSCSHTCISCLLSHSRCNMRLDLNTKTNISGSIQKSTRRTLKVSELVMNFAN